MAIASDQTSAFERKLLRAEHLFERDYQAVFGYAYRLTGSKETAAQLLVSAFVELNRELAKRRRPEAPREQILSQARRTMRVLSSVGRFTGNFSGVEIRDLGDLRLLQLRFFDLDPVARFLCMIRDQGATAEQAYEEMKKHAGLSWSHFEAKRYLDLGAEGLQACFDWEWSDLIYDAPTGDKAGS